MATFVNKKGNLTFHIPEKREEITREYIDEVLKKVKLSEHYCIVGLIYLGSLAELVSVKATKISVIPILCKYNSDRLCEDDIMKTVCIDRTSIERGNQLYNIKNELGLASIGRFIDENNLNKQALAGGHKAVAIEFKVIPVTDIKAIIGDTSDTKSFFKLVIPDMNVISKENAS